MTHVSQRHAANTSHILTNELLTPFINILCIRFSKSGPVFSKGTLGSDIKVPSDWWHKQSELMSHICVSDWERASSFATQTFGAIWFPSGRCKTQKNYYVTGHSLAMELWMQADPQGDSSQNIDGLLVVCGAFDSASSSYGPWFCKAHL